MLDEPGKAVGKAVRSTLKPGAVKDAISGTWLGHALHPLLTDVVIGSFLSATILDVLGGDSDGTAAERPDRRGHRGLPAHRPHGCQRLVRLGDRGPRRPPRRADPRGHELHGAVALRVLPASRAGRAARGAGKLLGVAGAAALGAAGYLGAHLTFAKGVGPNQTVFDEGPGDWATAADVDPTSRTATPKPVVVEETPVLLAPPSPRTCTPCTTAARTAAARWPSGEIDGDRSNAPATARASASATAPSDAAPRRSDSPSYDARESGGKIEIKLPEYGHPRPPHPRLPRRVLHNGGPDGHDSPHRRRSRELPARRRLVLEYEGYEVVGRGGRTAGSALRLAADVSSPARAARREHARHNGFEVAARLTADDPAPAVVLTSSRDDSDFDRRTRRSGARGFIPKAEISGQRLADLLR